jgi:hypothetical protein
MVYFPELKLASAVTMNTRDDQAVKGSLPALNIDQFVLGIAKIMQI